MPRIFLGNFEFEHELAGAHGSYDGLGGAQRGRLAGREGHSDLAWVWTAVAEAGDVVIVDGEIDAADFMPLAQLGLPIPRFCDLADPVLKGADWQVVPWGWTESLRQIAQGNGWTCAAPPPDVVQRVNSREFRFGLEHDWSSGLDGSALVRTLDELELGISASGDHPRGWILKANYGMSGREAIRGRGTTLGTNARHWAQKRLAGSGPIVFEPIVERVAEAGIQIEIPPAGAPELIGVTALLVDGSGVYRGSRFGCPREELACWQPAVDAGLRTAAELQRLGYFGPLGIDAMQYRDDSGELRLRPLQDLNARYTMGRLALGFCRVLGSIRADAAGTDREGATKNIFTSPPLAPPYEGGEDARRLAEADGNNDSTGAGWCGTWLHFNERHLTGRELWEWLADMTSKLPRDVIVVPASPRSGSLSRHGSVLLLAPSTKQRAQAERFLFDALGISVSDLPSRD